LSDAKQNLRLDKRLIRRRGWIRPEELERELGSLPDVSDKIQPVEEPAQGGEAGAPSGGAEGGA
jgi:hypothetical protein